VNGPGEVFRKGEAEFRPWEDVSLELGVISAPELLSLHDEKMNE
jgi:hypothetical protein